ncbi:hypothetical protein B0O99DRAFT_526883 [Bisporella sp. PMI_857]|nr:hypothetical protein B0O99DRAFT_526883 [Bisporella sp. PMI_857]
MYPPPPRKRGSDASSRRDRSASPPPSFWAALKRNARNVEAIEDEKSETHSLPDESKEDDIVPSHEVHCLVSSQHLMLASDKMRTLLTGDSEQSRALQSKGHVTIRLAVDADTMVILLNIIHGASKKVPRQVSLEDLKRLATSVNVLGMLDTVEFFSDTWIENLKREALPKVYNETVLSWLFISWVFNRPAEFKQMTKLAERESTERIQEDAQNIPVPMNLIDAIKSERERAMKASITIIHSLIEQYLVSQIVCHGSLDDELRHACDSMVLGSLMKGSRQIGIWPMPDTPFKGKNFKDLAHKIRSIRILDVCNKTSNRRWNSHGPSTNCHGLEDSIETSLKSLEAGLDGLNISEYTKNR